MREKMFFIPLTISTKSFVIEFSIKDKDFNDRFLFDHGQILSNLSVEYIYIVHTDT